MGLFQGSEIYMYPNRPVLLFTFNFKLAIGKLITIRTTSDICSCINWATNSFRLVRLIYFLQDKVTPSFIWTFSMLVRRGKNMNEYVYRKLSIMIFVFICNNQWAHFLVYSMYHLKWKLFVLVRCWQCYIFMVILTRLIR